MPAQEEIIERAERDANMLIARISKKDDYIEGCNRILVLNTKEQAPSNVACGSIVIQRKQGIVTAYWQNIDRIIDNKAFPEAEVQEIVRCLPSFTNASNDSHLIKLVIKKYNCNLFSQPLETQLLFYAAPLLAIADLLFIRILTLFCAAQQRQNGINGITCNSAKQKMFYSNVTHCWENHSSALEEPFLNEEKREEFIQKIAEQYSTCVFLAQPKSAKSPIQAVGLFYFKDADTNYVHIYKEALTVEFAENRLNTGLRLSFGH